MIILDYSGVAMAAFYSQRTDTIDEGMIRHLILNTIRGYNVKYRPKYGNMVLACDGGSWRKNVFAEYKASRKTNREESDIDWDEAWRIINLVREEITENLPYKVVQVKGAEADDIIATLVETTQEFGCCEDVMIISSDKDFIQLQKYNNVSQFSPMTKKLVTDKNPRRYLMEHIIRGCGGDGVPNVLSPDDVFIDENKRQKSVTKKFLDNCVTNFDKIEDFLDEETYRNFVRNRRCIDLSYIPGELAKEILSVYESQPVTSNSKVFNYLIAKRCKMLVSSAADFFTSK